MKNIIKFKILLLTLFSSQLFAAADFFDTYTKLEYLYPHQTGVYIITEGDWTEISNCDSGSRFLISKDHLNYDALVSSMMMAFAADLEVRLAVNSETFGNCGPTIDRFLIKR